MNNKRTELKVSAIRNGTVIDHIPSDVVYQVFGILSLDKTSNQVYLGTNLDSEKYGKKGIIKISNQYFEDEEISKIALVAPMATLIEIKDYEVTRKEKVHLPEKVTRVVKCINPKCVTNNQKVPTVFTVTEDHNGEMKLFCRYCEKTIPQQNIEFI
jgi:aspartate carbamoyltransferase regulatory subunit